MKDLELIKYNCDFLEGEGTSKMYIWKNKFIYPKGARP